MTPLFRMPVDVEFTTGAGAKKVRIEFSQQREEFTFPLDGQPVMTRFDPEGRVLMTVQFSKPAAELLYQLEHDPSVIGRIWAGEQLTVTAGDRAEFARALRERLLRDSFWGVRRAAAAALGQLKTDEARAALAEGLADRDPRVRQASVRALAQFFKDPQADRLVRKLYDSERNPVTAAEAVYSIGRIQANGAREFLERALRRDSDQDVIRRYALSGLRDLGDRGAWDVAVRWSRYGNPTQTRIVAVEAFSRLGGRDEKTADLLIALLDDPNLFVRERAIRELGEGGYQKARAALLRIADTEAQSSTRRAAQAALARLGGTTRAGFSLAPPAYSYRSASTGASRAARIAGQRPKKRPTTSETSRPAAIAHPGIAVGIVGYIQRKSSPTLAPVINPTSPPIPVNATASSRNCCTMSRRRAPTALRMPISRVRSVTETSMMFITPTPPISRPIELSSSMTEVTAPVMA
jgi:HEAT repeat protein